MNIAAHEGRHVDARERGYNTFLEPAQTTLAKKCGKICRCLQGEAETLLRSYLSDLRREAIMQYRDYVAGENTIIDYENYRQVHARLTPNGPALFDHFNWIWKLSKPKFVTPDCPK
jgi:hypothetical protein